MQHLPSIPKTETSFSVPGWPSVIRCRAFTTGQQALLLQVSSPDGNVKEKIDTIAKIFEDCVEAGAPFAELPIGIVEMIFLKLRRMSIGENMDVNFICKTTDPDIDVSQYDNPEDIPTCGQQIKIAIPLDKITCNLDNGFQREFPLNGGYTLFLREPSYYILGQIAELADTKKDDPKAVATMITSFIQCLTSEDGQVWELKSPEEAGLEVSEAKARRQAFDDFCNWVNDNIDSDVVGSIMDNYFKKIPRIYYKTQYVCPKCKTTHKIEFNGIEEIFN